MRLINNLKAKTLLLRAKLYIEPVTWGMNDAKKREEFRQAIKKEIPEFNEQYMGHLLRDCEDVEVELNCYLVKPEEKDIDNLAKIPIDAAFFSAQREIGDWEKWESKITSLAVRKLKSSQNMLEIIINEVRSGVN